MPAPTPDNDTQWTADAQPGSHLQARVRVVPSDASPLAEQIAGVKQLLLRATSGAPRKIVANATTIFARDPRWSEVFAYQALADRVVKLKPPMWHPDDSPSANEPGAWTDADTTRAQAWLSREYGLDLGAEAVNAGVFASAERHVIDPLKDYFAGLRGQWDGIPRCSIWLSTVFGAPESPYTAAVGSRWLISAVARALRPGCQVDHVLVTEGPQGVGKSTALRLLCPLPELFFDDEIVIGDKDAAQVLRGKWVIELGELSALSRHDLAATKAYITRRVDSYRPSFGRVARDFPRRCVFSASTNEVEYLKDPTGNRRFWPVPVLGKVDTSSLERHRDQLWAEALALFEAGAPWWLESEELTSLARVEQSAREQVHPWEEHVARWLAERLGLAEGEHGAWGAGNCGRCVCCVGVTTTALLGGAMGLAKDKQDRTGENTAGAILRGLGWVKSANPVRQDGSRVRPYFPPGHRDNPLAS